MSKLISLSEAISRHVQDGDSLYAAGFTHLIPFAAGHEIIRQNKRDLVLARATPDLIYDQLVAANCARKIIFSYMGNPGVGSLRIVRGAIERGEIEWEEYLKEEHQPEFKENPTHLVIAEIIIGYIMLDGLISIFATNLARRN